MAGDVNLFSLAGSIFSTACTAWFWLVRVRKERPNLTAHLLDHEIFLGQGRGETRSLGCKVAVVVANNSILSDAILGARLAVRTRAGTWLPWEGLTCDAAAALPVNLPPQQTAVVRLAGRITLPADAEAEGTRGIVEGYLARSLASPLEFEVEALGLHNSLSKFRLQIDPQLEATASYRVRVAA